MDERIYREYVAILKEELQPAMGCTEPIAVAYCAALARRTLGVLPETVEVLASANIIKNVKSVIVPNTNGQRGIAAAAAAGIVSGNARHPGGSLDGRTWRCECPRSRPCGCGRRVLPG